MYLFGLYIYAYIHTYIHTYLQNLEVMSHDLKRRSRSKELISAQLTGDQLLRQQAEYKVGDHIYIHTYIHIYIQLLRQQAEHKVGDHIYIHIHTYVCENMHTYNW